VLQRIDLCDRLQLAEGARIGVEGFPEDTLVRRALSELAAAAEVEPRWRVRPQAVLGGEIFDLQQQFPIHQARHVCQQSGQFIACLRPACIFSGL